MLIWLNWLVFHPVDSRSARIFQSSSLDTYMLYLMYFCLHHFGSSEIEKWSHFLSSTEINQTWYARAIRYRYHLKKTQPQTQSSLARGYFREKACLKRWIWTQGRLEGCQDTKVYFSKLTKVYLIFDTMIFKA